MANYKQSVRPQKTVGSQSQSSMPKQNGMTGSSSLAFVGTMLEAALGTFLYLRYIFPDDYFETMELRKDVLPVEAAPTGDTPLETMIPEDSQVPVSHQVPKPLTTKRVIGNSEGSKLFLSRLNGITEAVGLGYIRSFILYVVLDPGRPNQVLETVTFNFSYDISGPSCNFTRDTTRGQDGEVTSQSTFPSMTQQQMYQTMKSVLRDFVKESQDLPDLPEKRSLNFKVFYTDSAPSKYQVKGFEDATDDGGLVFGTHSRYEMPAEMSSHEMRTGFHGVTARIATIAGYLRPATDIQALAEAPHVRSETEKDQAYERHLDDADRRNVAWDAEAMAVDSTGAITAPIGIESQDGRIHELPESEVRSEADSDEGHQRIYAHGHGERRTNLALVPTTQPWGMSDLFVATQEAGLFNQGPSSQDTDIVHSDPDSRHRQQSAQVTGSLSQIGPRPNNSGSENDSRSNPEAGLISSDEHTDPSSQEFATEKDSFRPAPMLSLSAPKPKKTASRTATGLTSRTDLIKRSSKPKKAAKPKEPAKPREKKTKAAPTATKATTTGTTKRRAKPPKSSSESPTSGSSTTKVSNRKKTTPAKDKIKARTQPAKARSATPAARSVRGDGDEEEGEVRCDCGVEYEEGQSEEAMIQCDSCDVWKHSVCMGILRPLEQDIFFCPMCRVEQLEVSESLKAESQGCLHSLCLLRQILVMVRMHNKVVPERSYLCERLQCGIADIESLISRLLDEGLLVSETQKKGAPAILRYVHDENTKTIFSAYFRSGGKKEREELPGLAGASQIPSSQYTTSHFGNSQRARSSHFQASSRRSQSRQPDADNDVDVDMEMDPHNQSTTQLSLRPSGITNLDPIEENSTYPLGQGTLDMDVDDTIEQTDTASALAGRRFDRKGKRKAEDLMSGRPSARIRSATGKGFIECPFVEI